MEEAEEFTSFIFYFIFNKKVNSQFTNTIRKNDRAGDNQSLKNRRVGQKLFRQLGSHGLCPEILKELTKVIGYYLGGVLVGNRGVIGKEQIKCPSLEKE